MDTIHRVFISATSADLASHRQVVKEVLLANGVFPVEQATFAPDFRSVSAMIEHMIRECDAVVCLVGLVYGAEPLDLPPERLRRSFTQLEFDTARRLGKPVYLFIAREDCSFDSRPAEDPAQRQLQLAHRQAILGGAARYEEFSSHQQLRERVALIRFERLSGGPRAPVCLPYVSLGSLFKGRDSFLTGLRGKLIAQYDGSRAAPGFAQRQVLCGLGGVGKTRLAVEYAWRYREDYSAVLFVVADSPESLQRNLASLTGPLVLNLPDVQQGPEEDRVAAALRWLVDHPCWFMILDNVDTREAAVAVEELLARLGGGHVLITSRLNEWSRDVEPLELDVLAPADARTFLLERTARRRRTPNDEADVKRLLGQLDGLALALEQAGAFIERQRCSIGDYLKRWEAGEDRVRGWFDERLMHYPRSLAVTWDTTMRAIGPEATALLRLLAWFAPDPLPEEMLATPAAAAALRAVTSAGDGAPMGLPPQEALLELAAFTMVRRSDDHGEAVLGLHCVVQEITRSRLAEGERAPFLRAALELFCRFAPADSYRYETWAIWRRLIPHAEALWHHCRALPREEWSTDLLDALALYYMGQDDLDAAVPLQRLTLELKSQRLPADHPSLLAARNDLALMLGGHDPERETLYREALEGRIRTHGEQSVEVAETLHNYAYLLRHSGRFAEAESMMRRALATHTQLNGPFHWRSLMAEFGLARILHDKGEKTAALNLLRENLARKRKHLGPHHADTVETIRALANFATQRGDLAEAERLLRECIEAAGQCFGREHKVTLTSMNNLAALLAVQGRPEDAIRMCRTILDVRERLLGPDHTDTRASLDNLLRLLEHNGAGEEARRTLADFVDRLAGSKDAPPLALRQVALDCYRKRHYAAAEKLLLRVLATRFETCGTHCHLARICLLTGRADEAAAHVAEAWSLRGEAPAYVVPRMLWLQLVLELLSAAKPSLDAVDVRILLGRIKTAVQADDVHMEWSMEPVLAHLENLLAMEVHALLAGLVEAFSCEGRTRALDQHAPWREADPQPLD